MSRVCQNLDKWTKLTVYRTIIAPHFDYCSSMLFLCDVEDIQKLQILQNRAMRFILFRRRDTPILSMLSDLNWLSVKQRIILNTMILIYKMKNGLVPGYLSANIILVEDVHQRTTRGNENFRLPKYTKASTQNNVFYNGLRTYNLLPSEVKSSNSVEIFRSRCHDFIKVNLKINGRFVIDSLNLDMVC